LCVSEARSAATDAADDQSHQYAAARTYLSRNGTQRRRDTHARPEGAYRGQPLVHAGGDSACANYAIDVREARSCTDRAWMCTCMCADTCSRASHSRRDFNVRAPSPPALPLCRPKEPSRSDVVTSTRTPSVCDAADDPSTSSRRAARRVRSRPRRCADVRRQRRGRATETATERGAEGQTRQASVGLVLMHVLSIALCCPSAPPPHAVA
jgi:hypothetical protein